MKKRLDQFVFDKGLADSRTKAQALIMAGQVLVGGKVADKVGQMIDKEAEIELKEKFPYVSRGALKLQKAAQEFGIDFAGKVVVDIGSSTGGFTDFALQNGAKKVFAIDVGRGQLDQKLREDSRVVVMEKTDFRNVSEFAERVDIFVCDVSFISLKRIIPKIAVLAESRVEVILLIKPQFEVGKKEADRGKGVIKDPHIRQEVVTEIQNFAKKTDFKVKKTTVSPITGAKGNIEYLLYLTKM
jgi:23S rRNA (cytidine1920-2'-O)/16S rRNA (cytidine1409-2'-O)-methyltransferase